MGIILPGSRTIFRLKIFYFVILLLINISVFGLWYPTIYGNERAGEILKIWDPVEICIVMVMDMCLNLYFIISVKRKLLSFGLGKYKTLIKANVLIILANLTTDVCFIPKSLPPQLCLIDYISPMRTKQYNYPGGFNDLLLRIPKPMVVSTSIPPLTTRASSHLATG